MQFVYATGQPRNMEFAITSRQDRVPSGATIYATLCGSKAVENLDEDTFNAMSDEEFYTFRSLVQDARQGESAEAGSSQYAPAARQGLNKILGAARSLLSRAASLSRTAAGAGRRDGDGLLAPGGEVI